MKKKLFRFYIRLLVLILISSPLIINAQAIKKEILENYTEEDYLIFLQKEQNGEIPVQGGMVTLRAAGDALVNDNSGATTNARFTQSETTILTFGNNVVVGYNDAGSINGGANKFTGWSYSSDGGATFIDGGTLPTNPGGDAGDPVLARDDVSGRIYFSTLQFVGNGIPIYRSDDNGQSWALPTQGAPGVSGFADKQWIAVDNYSGTGQGNVYLIVRDFGIRSGIYFYSSTDNGETFGPNGGIHITNGFQGAYVAVGTDHSVYAFWWNSTSLQMRKSTDFGATFGSPITVASGLVGGNNGDMNLSGVRQGTTFEAYFRSNSFPHAAVNPVSGHIYVTYNNNPDGDDKADIFMVMSSDGGDTWSAPFQINDDGTTSDQWQPTIAVTPDGNRLGIFYYSRQDDINNNLFKFYGRIAEISGSTLLWDPNVAISDIESLPEFGRDGVVNSTYMGDYNQAAATNTHFHLVWSDNRDDLAGGEPRKDPNVYYKSIPADPFTGPYISVTPTYVHFGKIPLGNSASATLVVNNPGDEQLILTGWSLNNPVFSNDLVVPEFIPPDGSVTINLGFNPNTLGTFDGIFTIASNASNNPNVQIQLTGMATVENDICVNATPIPEIGCDPVTVSGSTLDASIDDDIASCVSISAPGVWYIVEGTGSLMTASTCNQANFDTKISVYTGSCESLVCIGGNDDAEDCTGFTSEFSWNSEIGESYYILVHGFGSATGNFDLSISTDGLLPEIAVSPLELNYFVPIDGSDEATLSITNILGECSLDLDWYIREGEYLPADPVRNAGMKFGFSKHPFENKTLTRELVYFIDQSTINNLENAGLFSKYPIRDQLLAIRDVRFTNKEEFYQTITSSLEDQYSNIVSGVMKYAIVEAQAATGLQSEAGLSAVELVENAGRGGISDKPAIVPDKNYRPQMSPLSNVLYDNGPLVNSPGTGVGGADESVLQNNSLGLTVFGFGHQAPVDNRISDEFTVTDPNGWQVDSLLFYAYQTNAPTNSSIVGVYYEIWDGPPGDPGSNIVFGDLSTNRLINTEWANIYRVSENNTGTNTARAIMANTVSAGFELPQATYWIVWQTEGSSSYSGPWAPPVTINGVPSTGNAGQYLGSVGNWQAVVDDGTGTTQGFPFLVYGESVDYCSWLAAAPNSGITANGTTSDVLVTVNATGLAIDYYYCNLVVNSNAININPVTIPVLMIVGTAVERIDALIAKVEGLYDDGVLNNGQANALIVKLEAAKKSIEKDHCQSAVNQLNAFINQVTDFIDDGILTSEQGNELIADASAIIDILMPCDDPKSGELLTDVIASETEKGFTLEQNQPNPFNARTTIFFSVAESNRTSLIVYNSLGQEVTTLYSGLADSDEQYSVEFDGSNLPDGIYFYRLQSGERVNAIKKMILMK